MPVLWGRALKSFPFALGLACFAVFLAAAVGNRVGVASSTPLVLLGIVTLPGTLVFWALDSGRRPATFGGIPRAWDDPPSVHRVDWRGRRRRPHPPNRGFVHADGRRLRAVWGTVYRWDLLVIAAAALAPPALVPELIVAAPMYLVPAALVLGLPRQRRVALDLLPEEVVEVRVGKKTIVVTTTRPGDDGKLEFSAWASQRDALVAHLRAAFADRVVTE